VTYRGEFSSPSLGTLGTALLSLSAATRRPWYATHRQEGLGQGTDDDGEARSDGSTA